MRWEACERGMWSERRCYYGRMLSFFPLSGLWGEAAAEEEEVMGGEEEEEEEMGLMGCLVQKTEESKSERERERVLKDLGASALVCIGCA